MPNDLPEIPELQPVTRRVAELSHELAEELGMIQCTGPCGRYYTREQMMPCGVRFKDGRDVYRLRPTCKACAEDARREDDSHSGWFERKDQPRRI